MKSLLTLSLAVVALAPRLAASDNLEFANTIKIEPGDTKEMIVAKAAHVVPNDRQLAALENGFIAFVHWGPNTFSAREWGTGKEDPKVFAPTGLDTDQWVKAMKDAGMKMVLLTVKHHDGFVLWQSRYTDHGVMSSGFMDGKADILRSLSESCRKYGIRLGIYLSPADLYQIENENGLYGNLSPKTLRQIPRPVEGRPFASDKKFEFVVDDYNEYFLNQLFELLTEYGPIHEVWFDGAHPKQKGGQKYNYAAWKELIHTLAPEAVVFGREDMRWCGNEAGRTRDTEWNVVTYDVDPDTAQVFHDMTAQDLGSREVLYKGKYLHYQPAETDVSIRNGWFYRDDDKQLVRSADDVFDMYERSAGGNAVLLLNVPPNRDGRFGDRDVAVLEEVGRRIRSTYGNDLLAKAGGPSELFDGDATTSVAADRPIVIAVPAGTTINRLMIQEPVGATGERIEDHTVEAYVDGGWRQIANATNVGFKRILRFPDVTPDSLRIVVGSSRLTPYISTVGAYHYAAHAPELEATRSLTGEVTITPRRDAFGVGASGNINSGYLVHYTVDGTEPTASSQVYTEPFFVDNAVVKAVSVLDGEVSPVMTQQFGYVKHGWRVADVSGEAEGHEASMVLDADPRTFWISNEMPGAWIALDMGSKRELKGFSYTPQTRQAGQGMIARGTVMVSNDGKKWKKVDTFEFGNLVNDPTTRSFWFKKPVKARYIRINVDETAADSKVAAAAEFDVF